MIDRFEQYERLGLLTLNNGNNRVGSGGLGMTDELPQKDFDGEHVRMIDMWGNSTPQIFSSVSPEMHWEFALKDEIRILERFGLNCYGCCEPLHNKIDILRRAPRLRRISMSPFVDIAKGAEAIGQDLHLLRQAEPGRAGVELLAPGPGPQGPRGDHRKDARPARGDHPQGHPHRPRRTPTTG